VKIERNTPKPGVYFDVPFEEYLTWDALSRSEGVTFETTTPAQYRYHLDHPKKVGDAADLGSAVDTYVFEGAEAFGEKFHRIPQGMRRDKRTKAYKEQLAEADGRRMLRAEDYDEVEALGKAAVNHDEVKAFLAEGSAQMTIVWEDRRTGILCKARPDFYSTAKGAPVILDMKVTRKWEPEAFARDLPTSMLHWQAAWYLRGASEAFQFEHDSFMFFLVKPTPVHTVSVADTSLGTIDLANAQIDRMLARFKLCAERNEWEKDIPGIVPIDLPSWYYRSFDEAQ